DSTRLSIRVSADAWHYGKRLRWERARGSPKKHSIMKQGNRKSESISQRPTWPVLLAIAASLAAVQRIEAATNIVVWDTGLRFGDTPDVENRAGWKSVPSQLFALEAEPLKAASDPGYYGREYSFKGDAVVENRSLAALFWSAKGRVVLYSKENANGGDSPG